MVSGHAKLLLADVETGETAEIDLLPGQRVTVFPMCAHKFVAVSETQVIEYYANPFDLADDVQFKGFAGDNPC